MGCALLLMGGYLEQATQFAQSHGGGGGSPKKGWGRDPHEDDRQWAYRCMMMSASMVHPGRKRKR